MSKPEPEPPFQTLAMPLPPPPPPKDHTAVLLPPTDHTAVLPPSSAPIDHTAVLPPSSPPIDHTAVSPPSSPPTDNTDVSPPSSPPTDNTSPQAPSIEGGTLAQVLPSAAVLAAMAAGLPLVRVPGYEIQGELGRGGMGVVYKARQLGLNRLVALKMILSGEYAGADDLARFRLEAEAVAKLQHPGIVQVYEINEVDGKPYFCLEYVGGGSLHKKFAGDPLPARQAAELLRRLAEAMEYAHQRHIVHRDLKPANVLLTADGAPKIADFGLAKRLDEQDSHTHTGSVLGTPSYMAPEQAHGRTRHVGPAADVYSLGVILYEALVGRTPFKGETVLDTLEQVRSQEPVPPSRFQARMPRDLETICLKCLQKEPNKRYASAGALAEDLRRFLAGEPILARPTPAWESAWKWARRRPVAAALTAVSVLFVLSLAVGGAAFGEYQRRQALEEARLTGLAEDEHRRAEQNFERAEQNFESARSAVDEMLTAVGQQRLAYEPRMEMVRRDLLARALHFQERFLKEKGDDPAVRCEIGRAHLRMGDIQEMLGEHEAAEQSYGHARTFFTDLLAEAPDDVQYRQDLATCLNNLGQLLKDAGRTPEAEQALHDALEGRRKLADEEHDEENQKELATVANNLGLLLLGEGRYTDADAALRESLHLREQLAAASPEPAYQQDLARAHNNIGVLLVAAGRLDDAEQSFRQALDILQGLVKDHPDVPDYRQELAVSHNHLGNRWRDVNPAKAEEEYQESLRLRERLVADFPTVPVYRQEQAASYHSLGLVRQAAGRNEEAEKAYDKALEIEEKLAADFPRVPEYQYELAAGCNRRAVLLHTTNRLPEAEKLYDKALPLLDKLAADHADTPSYQQELAGVLQNLAVLYQTTNRPEPAEKDLRRSADLRQQLADRYPKAPLYQQDRASAQLNLGVLWQMNGKLPEAEACYGQAVDQFKQLAEQFPAAPDFRHLQADSLNDRGNLLRALNRPQEAEKDWRKAAELLTQLKEEQPTVPIYRQELARGLNDLGIFLASSNRGSEAEKVWGQVLALQEELAAEFPKNPVYREELAKYHGNLGVLYAQGSRFTKAEQSYRRAVALLEELEKASPDTAVYWLDLIEPYTNLAAVLPAVGSSSDEGEKCWRRIVALREKLADAYPKAPDLQSDLGAALGSLAELLRPGDKRGEAVPCLQEAVRRQRTALELSPQNAGYRLRLCGHSLVLAQTLLDAADHAAAAAAVADLVQSAPAGWSDQHLAAACLARCAGLAAQDEKLPAAKREELGRTYGDRAMELLRQGVARGYKDVGHLKSAKEFEPLRSRDDFQKLTADLEKK